MHTTDHAHQCELDCGRPAPHTTICHPCVTDLADRLDSITDDELDALRLIGLRLATSADSTGRRHHTSTHHDAINIPVFALWYALTTTWPRRLPSLPAQPDAAHQARCLSADIDAAHDLVHGNVERTQTEEHIIARMKQIPALPTRHLLPWLEATLGIRIHAPALRKWVERGHLTAAGTTAGGLPCYHPADVLHAHAKTRRA
ncbi:hypothetical protein [Micrococcus lylae]|uniref:hypothetical protein n=2 Tax=Micrococcus lylae TaxID=1273 RepID=UPI00082EB230|nr:hypothetical protein [Micrococcus lylae]